MQEKTFKDEMLAAQDFRYQLQQRYAASDRFGVIRKENLSQFFEDNRESLKETISIRSGLPAEAVNNIIENFEAAHLAADLPTPLDDPFGYAIMKSYCEELEQACHSLRLPLRTGIVYGISPAAGIQVIQYPVPTTGVSIISVEKTFLVFCLVISKAMARSQPNQRTESGNSVSIEPQSILQKFAAEPELIDDWFRALSSYAQYNDARIAPPKDIPFPISLTQESILRGMELFALAHEFAHHISDHASTGALSVADSIDEESIRQEHEADFLAYVICTQIAAHRKTLSEFCSRGLGGVIMLKSLELLRKARLVLEQGIDDLSTSQSHPTVANRIDAMASWDNLIDGGDPDFFKARRQSIVTIFDHLWDMLLPLFYDLRKQGVKGYSSVSEGGGWLRWPRWFGQVFRVFKWKDCSS